MNRVIEVNDYVSELGRNARIAARSMATASCGEKNAALLTIANAIEGAQSELIQANKVDLENGREQGLEAALLDRLELSPTVIKAMAEGCRQVAGLPDPVGEIQDLSYRPSGIQVGKMRVPLGVIGIIYESRPNVTIDAAALCLKSGNATILRGGSEAIHSNRAIAKLISNSLENSGLNPHAVQLVETTDRAAVGQMINMPEYIDVIIPRGGEGLINYVTDNSKIPVIQHFKGVCHLYINKDADLSVAMSLLINGKTHRTGVCNAIEGLLVDQSIAAEFLPKVAEKLREKQVIVNACVTASQYFEQATVLALDDFGQEYLDLEIAIRIVDDADEAMAHIDRFGSHHTEVICTKNEITAKRFQRTVDASVVMVNASSRFSDGSELGLGAEIGIATTKLHAYGPMGVESLTTEKYLVMGDGQVRA